MNHSISSVAVWKVVSIPGAEPVWSVFQLVLLFLEDFVFDVAICRYTGESGEGVSMQQYIVEGNIT